MKFNLIFRKDYELDKRVITRDLMLLRNLIFIVSKYFPKTLFWKINRLNLVALSTAEWLIRTFNLLPKDNVQIINGVKMYLDFSTPYGAFQRYYQHYENKQIKFFESILEKGDVVLDLGAFQGDYALVAARKVGEHGKVYAFEPASERYELLLKNIELNSFTNIEALQLACSDQDGYVEFGGKDFILNSVLKDFGIHEPNPIKVKSTTLDSFTQSKNITSDVIKIDVEGAELTVLEGMKRILKKSTVIFLELHPYFVPDRQLGIEKIIKILADNNFLIYDWEKKSLINPNNKADFIKDKPKWHTFVTKDSDLIKKLRRHI